MFHPFGGGMGTSFERISDVPEFQNWLQEIKLELQGIYDRTHDTFVWETINLCGKRLVNIPDDIPSAVRRYGNHFLASLLCIPNHNFYENISKGCYAPQIRQGLD